MTRCICKTIDGQLGVLELADGVTEVDVVRAMRSQKLIVVPEAPADVTLEATPPRPGGETVVAGGQAKAGSSSSSSKRGGRRS